MLLLLLNCCSRVWHSATLWTVTHQASLSMGFSRQEYWSVLPFPPPGDLPDSGIEPLSPALHTDYHRATEEVRLLNIIQNSELKPSLTETNKPKMNNFILIFEQFQKGLILVLFYNGVIFSYSLVSLLSFCLWEISRIISQMVGNLACFNGLRLVTFYWKVPIWLKLQLLNFLRTWLLCKCIGTTFYKGVKNSYKLHKHDEMRDVGKCMYKFSQLILVNFTTKFHLTFFWNSNKFLNGKTYGICICQVQDI